VGRLLRTRVHTRRPRLLEAEGRTRSDGGILNEVETGARAARRHGAGAGDRRADFATGRPAESVVADAGDVVADDVLAVDGDAERARTRRCRRGRGRSRQRDGGQSGDARADEHVPILRITVSFAVAIPG
jgi:hypothetical protein